MPLTVKTCLTHRNQNSLLPHQRDNHPLAICVNWAAHFDDTEHFTKMLIYELPFGCVGVILPRMCDGYYPLLLHARHYAERLKGSTDRPHRSGTRSQKNEPNPKVCDWIVLVKWSLFICGGVFYLSDVSLAVQVHSCVLRSSDIRQLSSAAWGSALG